MSEPIPVMVRRFRCPHCPRSLSAKGRMVEHIARCWRNPAARGCLTCRHFTPGEPGDPSTGYRGPRESCDRGVDLSGRLPCGQRSDAAELTFCPDCDGSCADVKPGPITGCDLWEARP